MYSEQNEEVARRAYDLLRQNDSTLPAWELYAGKHKIRDLVNTFQTVPRAHTSIANAMEEAVHLALANVVAAEPVADTAPLHVPEPAEEPVKSKLGTKKK